MLADQKTYLRWSLGLTAAGSLFSGYLSGVRLFTGSCAFNESCPFFLGYPACWYGFAMFASMLGVSVAALLGQVQPEPAAKAIGGISFVGSIFAGHFVLAEFVTWLASRNQSYQLALPTCVYGLVFYIAILTLSVWVLTHRGLSRPEGRPRIVGE